MKSAVMSVVAAVMMSVASGAMGGPAGVPNENPKSVVDLTTAEGAALVRATWHVAPAQIHADAVDAKGAGAPKLVPSFGSPEFAAASWKSVQPEELISRQGPGGLSAVWYHTKITIPARVGSVETAGKAVVLCVTVDDYAELWVNGASPLVLGRSGGTSIAGFNAPNRVVLSERCVGGEEFDVAILGINGPISKAPANRVWIRGATLDFYGASAGNAAAVKMEIDRRGAALDEIVESGTVCERVCTGFQFTEGPVWVGAKVAAAGGQAAPSGYLLFSDPNANRIYRWDPNEAGDGVSVYREKSGYAGTDIGEYRQAGSNGLAIDPQGRLTMCEHGRRRVSRLEHNGDVSVLIDRVHEKRLNSPNDLVYRSDGTLFFTDPFFGLPKFGSDPKREIGVCGVYGVKDGKVWTVSEEFAGPNGLALSPDERTLYVGNWDESAKVVKAFALDSDGRASGSRVLVDLTKEPGEDAIDGLKVDERGNVYVAGPGGVWVVTESGKVLGVLRLPEQAHNLAWGDADGKTVYVAAQTSVYRVRVKVSGAGRR